MLYTTKNNIEKISRELLIYPSTALFVGKGTIRRRPFGAADSALQIRRSRFDTVFFGRETSRRQITTSSL